MTPDPAAPAVLYPLQPDHPELVAPFAAAAQRSGARRLWLCQSFRAEPHQTLAYLAGRGHAVPVGTAVTLLPLRHPYEAAVQARSLALLTDAPVVAGFGIGSPGFVAGLTGQPYASPRRAVRDYLASVRTLLDGGTVAQDGPYHRLNGSLAQLPYARVEVGAAVLRPGMARTAGEVADVAITWMTPPGYLADTLAPALAEGARERPAPPRIATAVHVIPTAPGRDPRALALAATREHLAAPHYADMLRRAGVPVDPHDPEATARALLDSGVVLTGTPEEIAEGLGEYRRAGVDEVVLNPAAVLLTEGVHAAAEEIGRIIAACRAARPQQAADRGQHAAPVSAPVASARLLG
ncbi:alkanesulfonate monooxygenase SsuD/methylene tetrahydromethanopterin reductase-like flavin-dependent oxidoreductase (luciferase family) [Kitasatospora sp. MAA19]|uniref:F420-dependent peptide dehydroalanine reductase LxmJ n=1 Tax=Kitasatospora sp. MAA19 TaxID=3035090 RepID=UPI0024770360|nr:F420-dependent peptide dehydroalanine reductase LxmJ [Kitasatospora sp. MAA19]MDH6705832.1 alkanesulfonate monooxygenase SsuD/methylene tetrahydromethanopterin reductase-like flavin-dependent oxidoreductase (luciferase family) [Kitasatospora sp. MAA19]